MAAEFTSHALTRLQQRSIPRSIIDLLQEYGVEIPAGRGAIRYAFDRVARTRLKQDLGAAQIKHIERWLNTYLIVGDAGQIVTVSHATRRFRRI